MYDASFDRESAMTALHADLRTLLELYADGELDSADLPAVETALRDIPEASSYLEALQELSMVVRTPIDIATERVSFEGLFSRVMSDVDAAGPAVDAAMAIRWADGELSAQQSASVVSSPEALAHAESVKELGDAVRWMTEDATASVDFSLLRARLDADLDGVDATREAAQVAARVAAEPEKAGLWARLSSFLGANKGVFASAVTAMLVAAVMVPLLTSNGGSDVEIHNHYPVVDSVDYQKGYSGVVTPGSKDDDEAPIVWFEPTNTASAADDAREDGSADGTGEGSRKG